MKLSTLLIFGFCLLLTPFATKAQTNKEVQQYLEELKTDKDLKDALLSYKFVNTTTQASISYQPGKYMIPASIQKLLTTGIGFQTIGSAYRFKTRLYYDGTLRADSVLNGRLIVLAGGDPSLGSTFFDRTHADSLFKQFYTAIKQSGIKQVKGQLVIDISYLTDEKVNNNWEWSDLGTSYGAGTASLCFHDNAFTLRLSNRFETLDSLQIKCSFPFPSSATIVKQVEMLAGTNKKSELDLLSQPFSNTYYLVGQLPADGKTYQLDCALQQPANAFATAFTNYLLTHGLVIDSIATVGEQLPVNAIPIATWESPSYLEIAQSTNAYSNNVFADMICKNIARHLELGTTFKQSCNTLTQQLALLGLSTSQIRIQDGSGLSRQNVMTSDFMCAYLAKMANNPDFISSIPRPGAKGTMSNFMINDRNRIKVRLKSGSMTGVCNYAGYIENSKGELICVSIMTNNFICKTQVVRRKLEKLFVLLAKN